MHTTQTSTSINPSRRESFNIMTRTSASEVITGRPAQYVQRHYEPLETDGPATCLVWFGPATALIWS